MQIACKIRAICAGNAWINCPFKKGQRKSALIHRDAISPQWAAAWSLITSTVQMGAWRWCVPHNIDCAGAWRAGPASSPITPTVRLGAWRWCVPHNSDCAIGRVAHENTSTCYNKNNYSKVSHANTSQIKARPVVCRRLPWSSITPTVRMGT